LRLSASLKFRKLGNPNSGVTPGTPPFQSLAESWVCLDCGATEDNFVKMTS
jgi:rubredoxin